MKKLKTILGLIAFTILMTGCQRQNTQHNRETEDAEIYDTIVQSNEDYGFKKENTCKAIFKCDISQISSKVIIAPTWEPEIFKEHVDNINKIAGPTGHGYTIYEISKGDNKFTYITTGIGACNLMDAVLALGQTNCEEIIFVGANGALSENIQIGDIMIPEYSICGVGADRYLCSNNLQNNDCFGKKYYPDNELLNKATEISKVITQNTDIGIHMAQNYSVDTIYAEYAHLDEIVNMGCNSIEMETATLFHTANIVGIKPVAIFDVSDNTISRKSLYSGRTESDTNRRQSVKKDIIPQIALKMLDIE